jgi:hypothetical protein
MSWSSAGLHGLGEPLAKEAGEAMIELDRGDLRARVEETGREQPKARADLEDPATRSRVGFCEDRLEHVGIGQEVLRQPVSGAKTGGAQRRADGGGINTRS